jgi:hypothetical protein
MLWVSDYSTDSFCSHKLGTIITPKLVDPITLALSSILSHFHPTVSDFLPASPLA